MISIIAAVAENRAIGKNNQLLWHIPEDFAWFKKVTLGHPIIMGRTTFESIGKPLQGRTNIIVTRNKDYKVKAAFVFSSLDKAIAFAIKKDKKEIFICGGGQIYEQAIDKAGRLYITLVKGKYKADTFFPEYENVFTKKIFEKNSSDKNHEYKFLILEKYPGVTPGS